MDGVVSGSQSTLQKFWICVSVKTSSTPVLVQTS